MMTADDEMAMIDDRRAQYEPRPEAFEESLQPPAPADNLGLSTEAWRLPLSLRIIAFVLVLTGVLGILEMILQLAVFGVITVNSTAVLALFIGFGLGRWNESWRRVAVFFSWLLLAGFVVGSFVLMYQLMFQRPLHVAVSIGGWEGGPGATVAVFLLLGAYCWWQLRVLRRPDLVRRFKLAREVRSQSHRGVDPIAGPRWQFSLRSLLLAMLVAAFVLVRLTSDDIRYVTGIKILSMATNAEGPRGHRIYRTVVYGVRTGRFGTHEEELFFAVLRSDEDMTIPVENEGPPHRQRAWFRTPEGHRIPLPGKHQLYEFVDGQLQTHNERVALAELQDFMTTIRDGDWSLDGLIKHAAAMRTNQNK